MPKFELPKDTNDRAKLKECLQEGKRILLSIESAKSALDDIHVRMCEEFDIPKKEAKQWTKSLLDDTVYDKAHNAYTTAEEIRAANDILNL